MSNKGVLRVAAGKNYSMALTESGDVYSWGAGSSLQLGHGSKVRNMREGSGVCCRRAYEPNPRERTLQFSSVQFSHPPRARNYLNYL